MTHFLTLNAGSSSVKFALFETGPEPLEVLRGQIEGLGEAPRLIATANDETIADQPFRPEDADDPQETLAHIIALLQRRANPANPVAIGHRVIHGGPDHAEPLILDDAKIAKLASYKELAPLHQPHNLALVEAAREAFPDAIQIACFDTAFHRDHPWVSDTYALPAQYYADGIRRYGFHGLAYEYAVRDLLDASPRRADGRVIVAHLGNGASMCAIRNGQSLNSTMGLTALDGLAMGTRCGQIDPGVVMHLLSEKGMKVNEVEALLYREAGLKGLSGLSQDMRVLEASTSDAARQAVDYFVHRIRLEIGAQAAMLGGLDLLAFSGGIGENSAKVRARVCDGFDWLGISVDPDKNEEGAARISSDVSQVEVRIVRTDEQLVIAHHCRDVLAARQN